MKHEPGKQYFISVVSLVTLESLAWTITGLLNGYDFVIILILIAGDLITAIIFFLPYLLWYNRRVKYRKLIALLPGIIISATTAYSIYSLYIGTSATLSLGMQTIIPIWSVRILEALLYIAFSIKAALNLDYKAK